MTTRVDYEWDEKKNKINIERHGISFHEAAAVFSDPHLAIVDTTRPEDREARGKALGLIEGRLMTVVFTVRTNAVRLISARRANAKEERAYADDET